VTGQSSRRRACRAAFGAALRDLLTDRNLRQHQAADLAGLVRETISHTVNASHVPNLDTVWAIADGLGVPLSTLIAAAEKRLADGRGGDG
jgi:transcriptional regulator with XRE-family HTH domain